MDAGVSDSRSKPGTPNDSSGGGQHALDTAHRRWSLQRLGRTVISQLAGEESDEHRNVEGRVKRGMILSLVAGAVLSIVMYGLWHVLEVSYRNKAGALVQAEEERTTRVSADGGGWTNSFAPSNFCDSTSCQQFSSMFQSSISYDDYPCSDFYNFVCKRWILARPQELSVKSEHRKRIIGLMRNVLSVLPHALASNASEAKVLALYKACLTPRWDVEALREILRMEGVTFDEDPGEHPLRQNVFVFEKIDFNSYAPYIEKLFSSIEYVRKELAIATGKNVSEWLPRKKEFVLRHGGPFAGKVSVADVFLYLGKALAVQFEEDDCIIVASDDVIKLLDEIFAKFSTLQLNRYVSWTFLRRAAPMADASLVQPESLRHYYCFPLLERLMHYSLTRRYLDTVVPPKGRATREAAAMSKAIMRSLLFFVDTTSWLTAGQKLRIRRQLGDNVQLIGYPAYNEPDSLRNFTEPVSADNALQAWALAASTVRSCQLGEPNMQEPLVHPISTQLAFSSDEHSLSVPAALLMTPFFGSHGLPGINYGAHGSAVSSAFVGLLQLYFRKEEVHDEATKRLECIKDAYRKPMAASTEDRLDTWAALRDFMGLFPAYRAFVSGASGQQLQGLDWLNEEQLFFVAFCYQLCDKSGPQVNLLEATSTAKFRCNVPLRHMPQFADAFNCSKGSPMAPTSVCRFWEASN
ncbi:membrane metallo-endopeptidase-like 1 [Haemaphysalis longicornis]